MTRTSLRSVPFHDPHARALVAELYAEQLTRYARADPPDDDPIVYAPPDGAFLLLCADGIPVGCGGYRALDATTGEIKRLYVQPAHRGKAFGRRILTALEEHGRTVGATALLLETGVRNTTAIALFESAGFTRVSGYVPHRDQYVNRAFRKTLSDDAEIARYTPRFSDAGDS